MSAETGSGPTDRVQASRHMDALEAGQRSEAWLQDLIARYPDIPAREIEYKAFARGDGTVTIFWHDNHPVGIAVAVRDGMNFTQLTLVESPKPPAPTGPAWANPTETDRCD